jgi:hypothetical protein
MRLEVVIELDGRDDFLCVAHKLISLCGALLSLLLAITSHMPFA